MKVADQTVVSINYTLTNDEGQVLDSSEGKAPLAYLHGTGSIIPGLESALSGHDVGDELNVTIPPADAYGEVDQQMIQPVPRDRFGGVDKIEPGMQFQASTPAGPRIVRVIEVSDDSVTIDANHPLAGQTLNFAVSIVGIRQATEEEISHGHVHGPDGHHPHEHGDHEHGHPH